MSATASVASSPKPHFDFLDGVRGLAALYVVFHHALINLPATAHPSLVERGLKKLGASGHYAVDVFIVLSGYCLMLPLLREGAALSIGTFLRRRAWRILPAYYLAMLASLLLIGTVLGTPSGTHFDVCLPVTRLDLLYHLVLFHDWSATAAPKINHVLWSVGVEWKIYFLFPVLVMLRNRIGALKTALLASAVGYAAWLLCWRLELLNPGPSGSSFYYLGLFAMGMLAAEIGERRGAHEPSRRRLELALLAIATLSLAVFTLGSRAEHVLWQGRSLFVGAWAALLLVTLRTQSLPRAMARLFSDRRLVSVGRIGYSVYLVHAPVLELVYLYLVRPVGDSPYRTPLMVALSMAATLLVAPLFYMFAERPFHLRSRRLQNSVPAPQIAS
jgi:peptidoglycan/LPS O-acetylase OafA/YrhL